MYFLCDFIFSVRYGSPQVRSLEKTESSSKLACITLNASRRLHQQAGHIGETRSFCNSDDLVIYWSCWKVLLRHGNVEENVQNI